MRPNWRRELCSWLTRRHSLGVEAALVVALYLAYDVARGLAANDADVAVAHARTVASLERTAHVFVEGTIQRAAQAVPGLIGSLDLAYVSLHLAVTGSVLLWLHRRRPNVFPFVRTTLLVASGLALIGFVVFPTAPPRLAALGITDTISGSHLNLNHGLISSLYNPYAAVPSMHIGYALVVGAVLLRQGAPASCASSAPSTRSSCCSSSLRPETTSSSTQPPAPPQLHSPLRWRSASHERLGHAWSSASPIRR